jgi:N-acetylglucosamine-6-phosphate deacetylase
MTRIVGKHYRTGELLHLEVDHSDIVNVGAAAPDEKGDVSGPNVWLAPAFVDIQVNGFAGHDINADDVTADDVAAVVRKLWATGVSMICPTVITGSPERMVRSLRAIVTACHDKTIAASIPAIHVEGPYISPEDGPRGAHPRQHVRSPDWDEYLRMQDAAHGRIGMVTLAPELPGGVEFIEKLSQSGVIPAIGHTAASAEDIANAVGAGAKISTHLGNGAHALLPRHPNYIWEQLGCDDLWASLIVDGHHLPPTVVKCMMRAKGLERCVLTSDAIAVAGLPPGRYRLGEQEVEVSETYRVGLPGTPFLMGSALELRRGVENAVRFAGLSLADAVEMASLNPARLLGVADEVGSIAAGQKANLILFDWDEQQRALRLVATLVHGVERHSAHH